jgi:site-specific DNA-methyltransferase (adenine-specific)
MSTWRVDHGDCLDLLRAMPDCSVDACVTDAPYGLSFMGKKWDYDVPAVEVWAECLRVLKPGGHLLAFAGTRTQHRMAVRIEDAGFEIRDMIAWVYGSGFPKSHNLDGDWNGWGTALKPALEPITMARKPFPGTVAANVMQHGTGAINVDGCRVPHGADVDLEATQAPSKSTFSAAAKDWTTSTYKPAGRWPANLIHDGSDEVLAGFPETKSGKMMPTRTTAGVDGRNAYGADAAGGFTTMETYGDSGSAARFFYCPKASKADREAGLEGMEAKTNDWQRPTSGLSQGKNPATGERSGVIMQPRTNYHPTVKPTALMQYLCRLVTPPGGTVLDPFTGSGSTGKAAMLEGFNFIGFEREAEYVEIARRRIAEAANVLGGPVCVA